MSLAMCLRAVWFGEMLVRETVPEKLAFLRWCKLQLGYCRSFCFCGHGLRVCVCLGLCNSMCTFDCVCLHVYGEEKCFFKKYVLSPGTCIQYACIPFLRTQTHTAGLLGTWDKTGLVFVYLFLASRAISFTVPLLSYSFPSTAKLT